jgi:opacity protein-like surface antigen
VNLPRLVGLSAARLAPALLCACLAPSVALAQRPAPAADSPWYVILNAGTSTVRDPSVTLGGATGRFDVGSGIQWGGAVGRRFGDSLRGELEISYRSNTLGGASVQGIDASQPDGDLAALFMMANVYYDFAPIPLGPARVRPYAGLGLGFAQEVDSDLLAQGAAAQFSGSRAAWQLALGVNWDYGSRWIAGVGLRYTDAGRVDMAGSGAVAGQTLDLRYRALTASVSVGYRF